MIDINLFGLLLFGLITGFIGGYAGIGGAPFMVMFLTVFMGYSQHGAQGTVLAVMLGPMSLLGIMTMKDKIKQVYKYAVIGVLTYAMFSFFGAKLAFLINSSELKIFFSALLMCIGINEIFGDKIGFKMHNLNLNYLAVSLLGMVVGVVGGFFGIGAGVLMVPIFIKIFEMPKDDARLLSLLILLPPVSLGAVIKYQLEGAVNWMAVIVIFIAYFITNYYGSRLAIGHSTKKFRKYYGIILLILGIINLFIN